MISSSIDDNNFRHNLLIPDRQVSELCKGFTNNLSANKKLSKTQPTKIVQLDKFIGIFVGLLLKAGL